MLRILGRTSSINVRKVMWAAAEAALAFTHEAEWGASATTRSPEFLALNPNGLIPVLITHEGALWESNTICRFLAAKAERHDLLPVAPFERAKVETWMDWQATELNTAWRPAFMALVRNDGRYAQDTVAVKRSIEQWNSLMCLLELRLGETDAYVTGNTFTLADVALGLSLQRWLLTPMARPATPALTRYRERLLSRRAVVDFLDPETP